MSKNFWLTPTEIHLPPTVGASTFSRLRWGTSFGVLLNAMEMDDALLHFFNQIDVTIDSFEMENDQGLTRKFSIDVEEGLLQGRGIKGFFAPYAAGILSIGRTDEHKIKVAAQNQVLMDSFEDKIHN